MYSCFILSESSRQQLHDTFPFIYDRHLGHHITECFGKDAKMPEAKSIQLYGYIDSEDGLEALLVMVDGKTRRPDRNWYHITWSLDPAIYKPVDSNQLINSSQFMPCFPVVLNTTPAVL